MLQQNLHTTSEKLKGIIVFNELIFDQQTVNISETIKKVHTSAIINWIWMIKILDIKSNCIREV